MKKNILGLSIFIACIFLSSTSLFSQDEPLTKDEWQKQMTEWTSKRNAAQAQLAKLNKEIEELKAQSKKLDSDVASEEDKLFQMYGMTRAEVEAFNNELSKLETKVQSLMHVSDEELIKSKEDVASIQKRVDEMLGLKVAKIPRFANRLATLKDNVASLVRTLGSHVAEAKTYIVGTWSKNHDCLWNIAKKPDIYANAWMWPKIWQGNREQIKNPDIIHPKQKLKIPEGNSLSKDEKAAANKYYKRKSHTP